MIALNDKTALLAILSNPGNTQGFSNSKIINKMLQAMYARQTSDEQADGATRHNNTIGFSGRDSEFLSDVAAKTAKKQDFFTPKQAAAVARCLKHYSRQLIEIAEDKMRAAGIVIPEKKRRTRKAAMPLVAVAPAVLVDESQDFNERWIQHKNEFQLQEIEQDQAAEEEKMRLEEAGLYR